MAGSKLQWVRSHGPSSFYCYLCSRPIFFLFLYNNCHCRSLLCIVCILGDPTAYTIASHRLILRGGKASPLPRRHSQSQLGNVVFLCTE